MADFLQVGRFRLWAFVVHCRRGWNVGFLRSPLAVHLGQRDSLPPPLFAHGLGKSMSPFPASHPPSSPIYPAHGARLFPLDSHWTNNPLKIKARIRIKHSIGGNRRGNISRRIFRGRISRGRLDDGHRDHRDHRDDGSTGSGRHGWTGSLGPFFAVNEQADFWP